PWLIRAQGVAQDLCRGLLSVEIGLGQSSRRRAVVLVIGVDRVERPGRLLRRRETEYSLAIREELARTGVLDHNRFAARQVARRPVAHPCILKLDAGTLVDAPGANEAAGMAAGLPDLSVGLHADFGDELDKASADSQGIRESLQRQFRRFESLVGR